MALSMAFQGPVQWLEVRASAASVVKPSRLLMTMCTVPAVLNPRGAPSCSVSATRPWANHRGIGVQDDGEDAPGLALGLEVLQRAARAPAQPIDRLQVRGVGQQADAQVARPERERRLDAQMIRHVARPRRVCRERVHALELRQHPRGPTCRARSPSGSTVRDASRRSRHA